jgi:hypothetical protein
MNINEPKGTKNIQPAGDRDGISDCPRFYKRIAWTYDPTTMSQARVSPSMNSCSGAFSSREGIVKVEVTESSNFSNSSPAMSLRETESR